MQLLSDHDAVIEAIRRQYAQDSRYDCVTNPGGQHNEAVGTNYPDVIAKIRGTNRFYLVEVETSDSVSPAEVRQWKDYSAAGGTWYLAVPAGWEARAQQLLDANGISNCQVLTWSETRLGFGIANLPGL